MGRRPSLGGQPPGPLRLDTFRTEGEGAGTGHHLVAFGVGTVREGAVWHHPTPELPEGLRPGELNQRHLDVVPGVAQEHAVEFPGVQTQDAATGLGAEDEETLLVRAKL